MLALLGLLTLCLVAVLGYPLLELLIWRRLWIRRLSLAVANDTDPLERQTNEQGWSSALLYLSGISHFAGSALLREQVILLEQAATVVNPDRCLALAFPYDPELAQAFRRFELWPRLGFAAAPMLVCSVRNFWQTWLASWFPNWYGAPVARCLQQRLGPAASPRQLVVIGNSAGGAILLSAAVHLRKTWPSLRMTTILCGAIFGESQGFDELQAFHQLLGERDPWVRWATPILPRRRPAAAWQRAINAQRYQEHIIGDMTHFGPEGYYSDKCIWVTSEFMVRLLKAEIGAQVDQPVATSYNVP